MSQNKRIKNIVGFLISGQNDQAEKIINEMIEEKMKKVSHIELLVESYEAKHAKK